MNYERVLAVLMVIFFIAAVVLLGMSHYWIAGFSLYVSLTTLVLLFIRCASVRSNELEELQTVRQ